MELKSILPPEPLKITAYESKKRAKDPKSLLAKVGDALNLTEDENVFEAQIDVESYHEFRKVNYHKKRGINATFHEATYCGHEPISVNLKIILDVTGKFSTPLTALGDLITGAPTVEEQVDKFLKICYKYNGNIHEPNFLNVKWGKFELDCKLKEVDIEYSLFGRGGAPMRAILNAEFEEDIPEENHPQEKGNSSPDITHSHTVKAGDSLPLLARKIYGSSDYYLPLAKANRLDHFRELEPGQEIFFPPIDQLETFK